MIVLDNNFVDRSDNNGKSTLHELNKRDKSTSAEKSRQELYEKMVKDGEDKHRLQTTNLKNFGSIFQDVRT